MKFYLIETQCMCIKKIVDSFKVIYIWREKKIKRVSCATHLGYLITWNLKYDADDIQLKRCHFYGTVNSLYAKFEVILNNPGGAIKLFMHIVCFSFKQWDLYSKSFNDVCTPWQKAVKRNFNLPHHTHICCHMWLDVNIYEII